MITVGCTLFHPQWDNGGNICICTTTMYVIPISGKSYAFCATLTLLSQVTAQVFCYPCVVHSVLPNHYRITKEHEPMGRLPPWQHIKHVQIFNIDYGIYKKNEINNLINKLLFLASVTLYLCSWKNTDNN